MEELEIWKVGIRWDDMLMLDSWPLDSGLFGLREEQMLGEGEIHLKPVRRWLEHVGHVLGRHENHEGVSLSRNLETIQLDCQPT